jgi:hypothetical protein
MQPHENKIPDHRYKASLLLILLLGVALIGGFLAFVARPGAELSQTLPTPPVPTAHIVSSPEEQPRRVIIPTPVLSATATPQQPAAATPESHATATPAPLVREGPGGLPYPLHLSRLNFGVVGHLYYTDREKALTRTREAGFEWFRQQIHWKDIEDQSGAYFWGELDHIVDDAEAHGVWLLISVVRSPTWHTDDGSDGLPDDPAALARFLGALAERYQGRVHAIEVWNEQNLAYENGGSVTLEDAGHYVELLAAAYQSIKAVDPRIIVVAGAPSSTAVNDPAIAIADIDYLKAMYGYRDGMIRDYFDVQAFHPGGSANPPETLWPHNPGPSAGWSDHETFYFRHVENTRRVMEEAGLGNHQVWITEFGWATTNNTPGYEFGNQVSFEMQRDFIVRAMERTYERYPWVSNMFLWNLNFTVLQHEHGGDPLHEQGSFSIVNADWSTRPAYEGIRDFLTHLRTAQNPEPTTP